MTKHWSSKLTALVCVAVLGFATGCGDLGIEPGWTATISSGPNAGTYAGDEDSGCAHFEQSSGVRRLKFSGSAVEGAQTIEADFLWRAAGAQGEEINRLVIGSQNHKVEFHRGAFNSRGNQTRITFPISGTNDKIEIEHNLPDC